MNSSESGPNESDVGSMIDHRLRVITPGAPGKIVFFGTMNVAPMAYALEFRRRGEDVHYFVDVPPEDSLSRPEHHFADVAWPYPEWITEFILPTQLLVGLSPRLVLERMLKRAGIAPFSIKAVVLSGHFVRFAPLFGSCVAKLFFTYGSDLDAWCNTGNANRLAEGMRRQSVFRVLPWTATRHIVPALVRRNFAAATACDVVIAFPKGASPAGDDVLVKLEAEGVRHVSRYDVAFDQFEGVARPPKELGEKLVVLSPVRFLFETFTEATESFSKGNDIAIRGLAAYRRHNPNLEVHFFEKGDDVAGAKRMCAELGLADCVVWHREMPFRDLIPLYRQADICLDQMGPHLVGAAGIYGMYMRRPLIANAEKLTAFVGDNPIHQAKTPEEVCEQLLTLSDAGYRRRVGDMSAEFVELKLGVSHAVDQLFRTGCGGPGQGAST